MGGRGWPGGLVASFGQAIPPDWRGALFGFVSTTVVNRRHAADDSGAMVQDRLD
jgi:hypothetical protein